jgi:hypothetical protein
LKISALALDIGEFHQALDPLDINFVKLFILIKNHDFKLNLRNILPELPRIPLFFLIFKITNHNKIQMTYSLAKLHHKIMGNSYNISDIPVHFVIICAEFRYIILI